MPKDEIEQNATLSRQEVARWLGELAKAIGEGGTMEVTLSGPPVTVRLADEFRCELEVEQHTDEIELEVELKWKPSGAGQDRPYARVTQS